MHLQDFSAERPRGSPVLYYAEYRADRVIWVRVAIFRRRSRRARGSSRGG